MAVNRSAKFKRLVFIGAALAGLLVIFDGAGRPDSASEAVAVWNHVNSDALLLAQNETQKAAGDQQASSSESNAPESKTDEKKEAGRAKKEPLKFFLGLHISWHEPQLYNNASKKRPQSSQQSTVGDRAISKKFRMKPHIA